MLISPIDTYYSYISAQMRILGAQVYINGSLVPQPMAGIVNAQDWPQTPPTEGGLYLLFVNAVPSGENSQTQLGYTYFLQWTWLLIGTDIQPTQQAQNRSDRYRTTMQIMENLRQANYPGWCRKMDYSADSQGNVSVNPSASIIPVSPIEMVTWNQVRFPGRVDNQKSGLVYGMGTVDIHAYSDVVPAVA